MNENSSDFCRKSYEFGKVSLDERPLIHTGLAWSREVVGILAGAMAYQTGKGTLAIYHDEVNKVFLGDFLNSLYCGLDKEILIWPSNEYWHTDLPGRLDRLANGELADSEIQAQICKLLAGILTSFASGCGIDKESEGNVFFSADIQPVTASSGSGGGNESDWWYFKKHLYINGFLPLEIKAKAVYAMIDRLRGKTVQSILEEYGTEYEWLFPRMQFNPLEEKMTEELKTKLFNIQMQLIDSFNCQESEFENKMYILQTEFEDKKRELEAEHDFNKKNLADMFMSYASDKAKEFGDTLEAGGSWFAEPLREGAEEWTRRMIEDMLCASSTYRQN